MRGRSQADGVTATLNIGLSPGAEGTDATSLLDAADAAMYEAKRGGGNSFAIRDQAPSAPRRADHRRCWHRDTSDAGPDRAPENPAGADAGNVDVDLEAVLQTVSELGRASLGLLAWELCVDRRAVATAWTAAIRDGMLKPAGYDSRPRMAVRTDQHRPGPRALERHPIRARARPARETQQLRDATGNGRASTIPQQPSTNATGQAQTTQPDIASGCDRSLLPLIAPRHFASSRRCWID